MASHFFWSDYICNFLRLSRQFLPFFPSFLWGSSFHTSRQMRGWTTVPCWTWPLSLAPTVYRVPGVRSRAWGGGRNHQGVSDILDILRFSNQHHLVISSYIWLVVNIRNSPPHWRSPSFFKMVKSPPSSKQIWTKRRSNYDGTGRSFAEVFNDDGFIINVGLTTMEVSNLRKTRTSSW